MRRATANRLFAPPGAYYEPAVPRYQPLTFGMYEPPQLGVTPPEALPYANLAATEPMTGITQTMPVTAWGTPAVEWAPSRETAQAQGGGLWPAVRGMWERGVGMPAEALGILERAYQRQAGAGTQGLPGQAGAGAPTRGGGAAAARAPRNPAPPGINQAWWDQFTAEHAGENPDQFYGRTGEGLAEALADREWSEAFARDTGRPPSEDEWRAHWFMTRTGATQEQRDEWRRAREMRRVLREQRSPGRRFEERPPVFVPPYVVWG